MGEVGFSKNKILGALNSFIASITCDSLINKLM